MSALDCGHEPTAGVASDEHGFLRCYACADALQLENARSGRQLVGYVSADGAAVTTWIGGKLLTITHVAKRRVGFGHAVRWYVRARADNGREWYGQGAGEGMVVAMRAKRSGCVRPGANAEVDTAVECALLTLAGGRP